MAGGRHGHSARQRHRPPVQAGVTRGTRTAEQLTITDISPEVPGDNNATSEFYLMIGWTVGRYVAAQMHTAA